MSRRKYAPADHEEEDFEENPISPSDKMWIWILAGGAVLLVGGGIAYAAMKKSSAAAPALPAGPQFTQGQNYQLQVADSSGVAPDIQNIYLRLVAGGWGVPNPPINGGTFNAGGGVDQLWNIPVATRTGPTIPATKTVNAGLTDLLVTSAMGPGVNDPNGIQS